MAAKKKTTDLPGRAPLRSLTVPGHGNWDSVEVTADSKRVLLGGWHGPTTFDLAKGKLVRSYRKQPAHSVNWQACMSRDGKRVVAGYGDLSLHFMDAASGKPVRSHTLDGIVTSVSIAKDAPRVLTGQPQKKIRLWDLDGEMLFELRGAKSYCWKVAIAPDARLAVSAGSTDPTVHCWDLVDRKELTALSGHKKGIVAIAFSPEGSRVASASRDGVTRLWRLTRKKHEEIAELDAHAKVAAVAFSRDGAFVATCGGDQAARVWDVATGKLVETFLAPEALTGVDFTAKGNLVAVGNALHVWE
jgi:WD40 repeat protein